ncbi:MAG: beta-lactamase family protein [Bdellovibrionales bacterium]|nr:beta-lactamase family protein [Bdellovibrionales bacterium]
MSQTKKIVSMLSSFDLFSGAALGIVPIKRPTEFFFSGCTSREKTCPINKDSVFDLASLTKPILLATPLAVIWKNIQSEMFEEIDTKPYSAKTWPGLTMDMILRHSAGFDAWRDLQEFFRSLHGQKQEHADLSILSTLLDIGPSYSVGQKTVYSDLGCIFLESYLRLAKGIDLPSIFKAKIQPLLKRQKFFFDPKSHVPLEALVHYDGAQPMEPGEVHDDNARSMGRVSVHAGLFSTLETLCEFAGLWLEAGLKGNVLGQKEELAPFFVSKNGLRPWVWDIPSGESTAGSISSQSIGHLGYTGTSLWIDVERQCAVVLLTNRVHMETSKQRFNEFRRELHNVVWDYVDSM